MNYRLSELKSACAAIERSDAPHLTLRQLAMMVELSDADPHPCGASDLWRSLRISKPAITRAADYLIHRGLVRRVRDPDDLRRVCISLTAKGRALLSHIEAAQPTARAA